MSNENKSKNCQLLYDVAYKDFESQQRRKDRLDSKVNVLLSFAGIYCFFFPKVFNFGEKISFPINNFKNLLIIIIDIILVSASTILFIIGIIKLFKIVLARKFRIPKNKSIFGWNKINTENYDDLLFALSIEIKDCAVENTTILNNLYSEYNKSLACIGISGLISTITYVIDLNFIL